MNQNKYTFFKEDDLDSLNGDSKICNVAYWEENGFVKCYGSLLRLFGEPEFSSEDFEASYLYFIKAKDALGKETPLTVYFGPTGPAIGGDTKSEMAHAAAQELLTLLLNTAPLDYDYSGYYLDAGIRINCGIKQGEIYYQEEPLDEEELERIMEQEY